MEIPGPELIDAGLIEVQDYDGFRSELSSPRAIFIYIPAGPAVDRALVDIADELDAGDILVDGGNSYWGDSIRRHKRLKEKGINFIDLGTSGGIEKRPCFGTTGGGDNEGDYR
ncbi:MAG: hypothetical protein GQ528_07980 [Woeseiaceae bacterium]|nr:hypothetical protein [Woeseiaceae bacterium]